MSTREADITAERPQTERQVPSSGESRQASSASEKHPLLSLAISASYAGKPNVLRELRLDMAAGEILGLVGESGSGKSTLALSFLRPLALKGGKTSGSTRLIARDRMG